MGTELLLGHVVDTNSAWLGERLAAAGIDCHFQTRVGDNREHIAGSLRTALARSDVVVACGGLGPTPDDITREALADVMGVGLVRDEALLVRVRSMFERRGRAMSPSNDRQADVPVGARPIPQTIGTAPGLVCPVGEAMVYAVPGVPAEMREMVERAVLPDLRALAGRSAVILSRVLHTWGMPESVLAEALAPRLEALDAAGGELTMAFVAAGIDGMQVRLTAKAGTEAAARALLDAEEHEVRALLGPVVVGTDDRTLERAIGSLLEAGGRSLGLAESLTGGWLASRLVAVAGASAWFRGSIVAYHSEVKRDVLGLAGGAVVSEEAAGAMAWGARRRLGADVGLGVTGVAGPDTQEGVAVGTVFVGTCVEGATEVSRLELPGDRQTVRRLAVRSSLGLLHRRLLAASGTAASGTDASGRGSDTVSVSERRPEAGLSGPGPGPGPAG